MKEISLSGKQKKLNRGGSNVNTRFNYTADRSSYWGSTIFKILKNIIYKIIH